MKASRTLLIVAALALIAVVYAPAGASAASPEAQAAKSCSVSGTKQHAYGPIYTYKLSVRHATCSGGKNLVRAWDSCRSGGHPKSRSGYNKGCSRVLRYRCSEHRFQRESGVYHTYLSDVSCKRGNRRVSFRVKTYKEDTA
jgi:curli biogenesis system outer membrane secretion channel CsgG